MDLDRLIEALADTAAYPYAADSVEVRHTHISVVFLAGPYVYKIKKPVNLGFLDFTTLERRRHFCAEEVRLNRRLAPDVYLGVVPITKLEAQLQVEGSGPVVEWAVKMRRLPDEATLLTLLRREAVDSSLLTKLARRIAVFHAHAEAGEQIAAFGRFEVVARNARENFTQAASNVGVTLSRTVYERLQALTEEALVRLQPLIEARAKAGVPRDTHGDLRLDHVYYFPEVQPPADLIILDCVEFDGRFRFADPIADMAFLYMDLAFHGRRDLARVFADAYLQAAADDQGRELLSFYSAYRAAVRGKVEGMEVTEREVPEAERCAALIKAQAHWLLALGQLEVPQRRPCLILVGGLPGTGKSTLSRGLARRANFCIVRSDQVRKELAAAAGVSGQSLGFAQGIYTPEWTERTYAECLRRVEHLLFEGYRVIVDASFVDERRRLAFLETAVRWGVPGYFFHCQANPEVVRQRLTNRCHDLSDADWTVHLQAARQWGTPTRATQQALHVISTDGEPVNALLQACRVLHELGLADPMA